MNDESPRLRPGDDLAVRLDPTDPGHVAAEDFDNQLAWVVDLEIWALVLGLTLVVVGSICQAVAVRVRRRSRRRTLSA